MKQAKVFFSLTLIIAFISTSVPQAQADQVAVPVMPSPGTMVALSQPFAPALMSGIVVHPDNALQFDFIMQRGQDDNVDDAIKLQEYNKLIKYFLASLTIPEKNQWVNLSPYEKDRIIEKDFGRTEMGRDLLAQDYLLKQITSSLMYPESGLGKEFWNKIYEKVSAFGGNIPVNTFNKVWIVPSNVTVYESGNSAVILKSHLKVMLEEDYLATAKNHSQPGDISPTEMCPQAGCQANKGMNVKAPQGNYPKPSTSTQNAIRQIILPALEKEVNEGKNFASLRQVVSAMILATWYKKALKESLLGKVYMDQAKVNGVDTNPKNNDVIYERYLEAFKKGVYSFIKEEVQVHSKQVIPRKYFAGGVTAMNSKDIQYVTKGNASFAMTAPIKKVDQVPVILNPIQDEGWYEGNSTEYMADQMHDYFIKKYGMNLAGKTVEGVIFEGKRIMESVSIGALAKDLAKDKEINMTQSDLRKLFLQGKVLPFRIRFTQDGKVELSLGENFLNSEFLQGSDDRRSYVQNTHRIFKEMSLYLQSKQWVQEGVISAASSSNVTPNVTIDLNPDDQLIHIEFFDHVRFKFAGTTYEVNKDIETGDFYLNAFGGRYKFSKEKTHVPTVLNPLNDGQFLSDTPYVQTVDRHNQSLPVNIVLDAQGVLPKIILNTQKGYLNVDDVVNLDKPAADISDAKLDVDLNEPFIGPSNASEIKVSRKGNFLIDGYDGTQAVTFMVGGSTNHVLFTVKSRDKNGKFYLIREFIDNGELKKVPLEFVKDFGLSNETKDVFTTMHAKEQVVEINGVLKNFVIAIVVDKSGNHQLQILNRQVARLKLRDIKIIKNHAMSAEALLHRQGGIDLNVEHFDMSIKRDGKGVPLPIHMQNLNELKNIQGFMPRILEIKSSPKIPILSEIQEQLKPARNSVSAS